mmetsp:Transcript_91671/g.290865  ORF Transcript_91671/g.290865 Transcript_91671/m.290865 type:complete len:227 (-) Transcript_91671:425-1105(-)
MTCWMACSGSKCSTMLAWKARRSVEVDMDFPSCDVVKLPIDTASCVNVRCAAAAIARVARNLPMGKRDSEPDVFGLADTWSCESRASVSREDWSGRLSTSLSRTLPCFSHTHLSVSAMPTSMAFPSRSRRSRSGHCRTVPASLSTPEPWKLLWARCRNWRSWQHTRAPASSSRPASPNSFPERLITRRLGHLPAVSASASSSTPKSPMWLSRRFKCLRVDGRARAR